MKLNPIWLRISIGLGAALIVLSGSLTLIARANRSSAMPSSGAISDCSIISCTAYLPLILGSSPHDPQFEITQGVQQPDNSVVLVANRTTFVRWTLTATVAQTNVTAYLYGYTANGTLLSGSPLAAFNNPRTLKATANRAQLNDTFDFQLPPAWISGTLLLRAEAANNSGYFYDTTDESVTFHSAKALPITIVPISYHCTSGGSGTTTPAAPYNYLTDFTYRVYPVPSVNVAVHAAMSYQGPCTNNLPTPAGSDWDGMLDAVTSVWNSDNSPARYYYGLVHIDCGGSCIAGEGWIGFSKAAVGFDGIGPAHAAASETHAHEVGHNHGRNHAPGCGAQGVDPNYPYANGLIGDAAQPVFGFDLNSHAIYPYTSYNDLMNYCDPTWISDYTYRALWAYDNPGAVAINSTPIGDRPTLRHAMGQVSILIAGSIDARGQVKLDPAYSIDLPARLPVAGDYTIELIDARGSILASYSFEPVRAAIDRYPAGGSETSGFSLRLPDVSNVAAIRVRHNEVVVGSLQAGSHAPTLSGSSAASGTNRQAQIDWSTGDLDREPVYYLVRASIDRGATWQTIGVNLTASHIDLDRSYFGGHTVLLQILASDGVHTSQLNLGPYSIP